MNSLLVKILGYPALLVHGDTSVLDRWLWLRKRLGWPKPGCERLIEAGCGNGVFSMEAARRGYDVLALDMGEANIEKARKRSVMCGIRGVSFEMADVRFLDEHHDLLLRFDTAVSLETLEHILDDRKFMRDLARCLKPGGRLLLTTPNADYIPIGVDDVGPFLPIEDGRHVRKGYTEPELRHLCAESGLVCEQISFASGFLSQKIIGFHRRIEKINPLLGWILILPFRMLPPLLDPLLTKIMKWPGYSICLEAHKA